jgi:hypothetical protein
MKKQQALLIVVALVIIVAAIVLLRRPPAPVAPSVPPVAPVVPETQPGTAAPLPAPEPVPEPVMPTPAPAPAQIPTEQQSESATSPEGEEPIKLVRPESGQVLATVNGTHITVEDMMYPSTMLSSLPEDTFKHLLNSAIERELIEQAARSQGIGLSAGQQKQLEDMRAEMENPSPDSGQPAADPQQIDYELRMTAAAMLRGNLAASAGVPSPYPTREQVQAYYAAHRAEFGELPADPAAREAAWQKMDAAIRERFGAQYQEAMQQFLEQLRAAANISIAPPAP